MRRKRIITDTSYTPRRGDRICLRADPNQDGGTIITVGDEQSEVKWDVGYTSYYPHRHLMLKPVRQRKRLLA